MLERKGRLLTKLSEINLWILRIFDSHPRSTARETCFGCMRPDTYCICKLLQPLQAHCNILILQHPRERRKYYSTAKLVLKGIQNSSLLRGVEFDHDQLTQTANPAQACLLYPGETALDCEQVYLGPQHTVIVLDGTWSQSRKILRLNPLLQSLPALTFKKPLRSNYRIRKQPREHCLSTLESVAHLLQLNALASGRDQLAATYNGLFEAFSKMVDQQLLNFPRNKNLKHVSS